TITIVCEMLRVLFSTAVAWDIGALCNAVGFIIVYLGAWGWAAIVLGIVGASLGCCVCCGCCKAKMDPPPAPVGQVQQVQVVGTPTPA
ncbi:unnamed protein product, partial [Durusdinium trenchii]